MSLRKHATLIAATVTMALASTASASENFSFPSANGAVVVATTPTFGNQAAFGSPNVTLKASYKTGYGMGPDYPPLPAPTPYEQRFSHGSPETGGYAFTFLTRALGFASYANYAADYYRLFAPNYAVNTWTDRAFGVIDAGYGGAVDSWTAGAYYLGRARGPRLRRETAPDLNPMPKFRPHPELEGAPTFEHD